MPVSTLGLVDFYHIHKKVQADCKQKQGWETEVYVKGSGKNGRNKTGRLDLYDSSTNAYYEVKSRGAAYNIFGNIRESTVNQMQFYDEAVISSKKVPNARGLTPTRGNQYVSGKFEYGIWDVAYELELPGLIVYDVTLNPKRAAKAALTAGAIGLAAATGGASLPYSAPAIAMIGG